MRIGVLRIDEVNSVVIERIQENLRMIFPRITFNSIADALPMPEYSFDQRRQQYRSDVILKEIRNYLKGKGSSEQILGIVDKDVFVPQLNFVFGEAECPGKAALVSLCRLRPEFYGSKPNLDRLIERSTKEAVHELGHTLGVGHCPDPFCVMHFSNSIFETDRKRDSFCSRCSLKTEAVLNRGEKRL